MKSSERSFVSTLTGETVVVSPSWYGPSKRDVQAALDAHERIPSVIAQRKRARLARMAERGIVRSNEPGVSVGFDDSVECLTCMSKHCTDFCHATTGTVYVVGDGWLKIEHVRTLPKNRWVHWHKQGWLKPAEMEG